MRQYKLVGICKGKEEQIALGVLKQAGLDCVVVVTLERKGTVGSYDCPSLAWTGWRAAYFLQGRRRFGGDSRKSGLTVCKERVGACQLRSNRACRKRSEKKEGKKANVWRGSFSLDNIMVIFELVALVAYPPFPVALPYPIKQKTLSHPSLIYGPHQAKPSRLPRSSGSGTPLPYPHLQQQQQTTGTRQNRLLQGL